MVSEVVEKARRILETENFGKDGSWPGLVTILDEINTVSDLVSVAELLCGPANEEEARAFLRCVWRLKKAGKKFNNSQTLTLQNNGISTTKKDVLEEAEMFGLELD